MLICRPIFILIPLPMNGYGLSFAINETARKILKLKFNKRELR
jgi:hypothetical protein